MVVVLQKKMVLLLEKKCLVERGKQKQHQNHQNRV
jgi:hypothetical protein